MKKVIFVLTAMSLLGISNCNEEGFSRYPSVSVPEFANEDYYNQLSGKNTEVVYNAVVNLGEQAARLSKLLSDDKANKNSPEYITAEKIYHKIVTLLNSSDSKVAAASLRFLQLFSANYSKKAELLGPVTKINSNNPQVIYEQMMMLERIAGKDTVIDNSLLRKFLDSPSWIVSRSSYLLVNKLENENLRKELIARYKTLSNEQEKLLILNAFKTRSGDSDVDFFFSEIESTKNSKIRYAIYDILGNCKDREKALAWFTQNYEKITPDDRSYLFKHYAATMEEYFSSRLLAILLSNGFMPGTDFIKVLGDRLDAYSEKTALSPQEKEYLYDLKIIEKALIDGKTMAVYWQSLSLERKAINDKIAKLQVEYNAVAVDAAAKIDAIFKKYGVSEKMRKEYLENITNSRETLKALFEPDEENTKQE